VIVLPLVALALGVIIALMLQLGPVSGLAGFYVGLACLAGLDTVCGGVRSGVEGKFSTDVFLTGFVSNVVIAFFLAWLGDQIGINLFLAAVLVMGSRIFTNLSLIRRMMLTKWRDARERRRLLEQSQSSQS